MSKSLPEMLLRLTHVAHALFVGLPTGFSVSFPLEFASWYGVQSFKSQKKKLIATFAMPFVLLDLCSVGVHFRILAYTCIIV
jgi:hypothetical protein